MELFAHGIVYDELFKFTLFLWRYALDTMRVRWVSWNLDKPRNKVIVEEIPNKPTIRVTD